MFLKTSFQVGVDLKKVQKQGRNDRTQEDYPLHLLCFFGRRRVVFLSSLIACLSSRPSLLETKFAETFSLVEVLYVV